MKNLILIICTILSVQVFGQNTPRNVYFVHGYRGDGQAFKKVADYVGKSSDGGDLMGKYKLYANRINYSGSEISLQSASNEAKSQMKLRALKGQTNRDFVIAHSQGGLVTRNMKVPQLYGYKNYYNGFITFGTPHQGAYAANTLVYNREKIYSFLNESCDLFGTALAEANIPAGLLGDIAVAAGLVGLGVEKTCDATTGFVIPKAVEFMMQGIEKDLTTTAAQNIPPMATQHNAVFYGIEDDTNGTLAARFIGSFSIKPPNEYNLYEAAGSDLVGINFMAAKENYIQGEYNHWKNMNIFFLNFSKKAKRKRLVNSYSKALTWFESYNDTWKELIGVNQTRLEKNGCLCEERLFGDEGDNIINYIPDNDACVSLTQGPGARCSISYKSVTETDKPSDGFILKESAVNAPGRNYPLHKMQGSNHMQMKNDSNMEDAVKKIFEGRLRNPNGDTTDFFYTEPR